MGLSGTFKLRLNWNSDPTIQGLYVFAYIPPNVTPTTVGATNRNVAMWLTGCPHVIVNISRDTSAELVVPYVGETPFFPMVPDGKYFRFGTQLGSYIMCPIHPVESTESPLSVRVTYYFAMDNVKTMGNIGIHAKLQASAVLAATVEAAKKEKLVSKATSSISNWLNNNKSTGFFGSLSRGAGWLFGGASKIADLLGMSKPTSLKALKPTVTLPFSDCTTADQTFAGYQVAQSTDHGLSNLTIDDRQVDPMIIKNAFRNELLPYELIVSKTHQPGDKLLEIPLLPSQWFTRAEGVRNWHTHFSYYSQLFKFWRGGIHLHIQPVCTKFHSTRIRVVYSPYNNDNATEIYETMSYTYSWVVDISDPDTWSIIIPFVSINAFCSTDFSAGSIFFFLENDLVSPDNVPSSIELAIFAEPGDDFEYACPDHVRLPLWWWRDQDAPLWPNSGRPSTYAEDGFQINQHEHHADLQSNPQLTRDIKSTTSDSNVMTFIDKTPKSSLAHQMTIGDPIRSFSSVIKRMFPCYELNATVPDTHTSLRVAARPAMNGFKVEPPTINRIKGDFITKLAATYVFFRGGMRFGAQNFGESIIQYAMRSPYRSTESAAQCIETGVPIAYTLVDIPVGPIDPVKFEMPYYEPQQCINMWKSNHFMTTSAAIYYPSGIQQSTRILRSVADDFQMGFLVGAPPC